MFLFKRIFEYLCPRLSKKRGRGTIVFARFGTLATIKFAINQVCSTALYLRRPPSPLFPAEILLAGTRTLTHLQQKKTRGHKKRFPYSPKLFPLCKFLIEKFKRI